MLLDALTARELIKQAGDGSITDYIPRDVVNLISDYINGIYFITKTMPARVGGGYMMTMDTYRVSINGVPIPHASWDVNFVDRIDNKLYFVSCPYLFIYNMSTEKYETQVQVGHKNSFDVKYAGRRDNYLYFMVHAQNEKNSVVKEFDTKTRILCLYSRAWADYYVRPYGYVICYTAENNTWHFKYGDKVVIDIKRNDKTTFTKAQNYIVEVEVIHGMATGRNFIRHIHSGAQKTIINGSHGDCLYVGGDLIVGYEPGGLFQLLSLDKLWCTSNYESSVITNLGGKEFRRIYYDGISAIITNDMTTYQITIANENVNLLLFAVPEGSQLIGAYMVDIKLT